jgi:uncharacterized protein YkwD
MRRYGDAGWHRTENISYGQDEPVNVVVQLLIDDGLSVIQARDAMINPYFKLTGAYSCPHSIYKTQTVVMYSEQLWPNEYCWE